jgi:outer membrane protein assembly factor BamB
MNRAVCVPAMLIATLLLSAAQAATPILTRSYDNGRTGANLTETVLTPQLLATKGLRLAKSLIIDDDPRIEAQPLYVPNLLMSDGKTHNVIFVASMGNHIFAFDADAAQGQDLLWKTSLGMPFRPPEVQHPGEHRKTTIDLYGINILWGILSTPVIDVDAGVIYCVNWTVQDDGKPALFLHRIRLQDGRETSEPPGGLRIQAALLDNEGNQVIATRGKPVSLQPDQKQRAALLLTPLSGPHKVLFVATTGGEVPGDPHGWVLAFDTDTFTQTAAWVSTRRGFGGGIWQGSAGPAADEAGNVYVMTGNGGYSVDNAGLVAQDFNGTSDFAEAFAKLSYRRAGNDKGSLDLVDWFIPFRDSDRMAFPNYNYRDQDLSSAGPLVPPGTNILLGAGKDGILYVFDRNNLGRQVGTPDSIPGVFSVLKAPPIYVTYNGSGIPTSGPAIDFPLGNPTRFPNKTHHLHGSPAYWDGTAGPMLFVWGENESLRAWKVDPGSGKASFIAKGAEVASAQLALRPDGIGGMPGGMVTISSNGKIPNTGIVWATAPMDGDANHEVVQGILRAYDAVELDPTPIDPTTPRMKLLWDSNRAGVTFNHSKFCPPVVADGRVLVTTYDGRVDVYAPAP